MTKGAQDVGERPFVVDRIELHCNGCPRVRVFVIDPPLRSAEELITWLKTKPGPCDCGARTCDVKARIADQN